VEQKFQPTRELPAFEPLAQAFNMPNTKLNEQTSTLVTSTLVASSFFEMSLGHFLENPFTPFPRFG
jgi:hypothetical protein